MIDVFALISGFLILCVSALVVYTVRRLLPSVLIIAALVALACVAAVRFGLFAEVAPLLVIYINGALMGALGGYLFLRTRAAE